MNTDIFTPCRLEHLYKIDEYPKDLILGLRHLHDDSAIVIYVPLEFSDINNISIYIYNTHDTLIYKYNLAKYDFVFSNEKEYDERVIDYLTSIEHAMNLEDFREHIHFLENRTFVAHTEVLSLHKFYSFLTGTESYDGVFNE